MGADNVDTVRAAVAQAGNDVIQFASERIRNNPHLVMQNND